MVQAQETSEKLNARVSSLEDCGYGRLAPAGVKRLMGNKVDSVKWGEMKTRKGA